MVRRSYILLGIAIVVLGVGLFYTFKTNESGLPQKPQLQKEQVVCIDCHAEKTAVFNASSPANTTCDVCHDTSTQSINWAVLHRDIPAAMDNVPSATISETNTVWIVRHDIGRYQRFTAPFFTQESFEKYSFGAAYTTVMILPSRLPDMSEMGSGWRPQFTKHQTYGALVTNNNPFKRIPIHEHRSIYLTSDLTQRALLLMVWLMVMAYWLRLRNLRGPPNKVFDFCFLYNLVAKKRDCLLRGGNLFSFGLVGGKRSSGLKDVTSIQHTHILGGAVKKFYVYSCFIFNGGKTPYRKAYFTEDI